MDNWKKIVKKFDDLKLDPHRLEKVKQFILSSQIDILDPPGILYYMLQLISLNKIEYQALFQLLVSLGVPLDDIILLDFSINCGLDSNTNMILDNGYNVTNPSEEIIRAIFYSDDCKLLKKMIDHGLPISDSLVDHAITCNKKDHLKLLISLGANIKNLSGFQVDLIFKYASVNLLEMLLDYGLDKNYIPNPNEDTEPHKNLIQRAIIFEKLEHFKLLLKRGASCNSEDIFYILTKQTVEKNNNEILSWLVHETSFDPYCMVNDVPCMLLFVQWISSTNMQSSYIVKNCFKEILENCPPDLEFKKDILNAVTLNMIERGFSFPIIKVLLQHGADINFCDHNERSLLEIAIKKNKNVIYDLIKYGANITKKHDPTKTEQLHDPVYTAISNKNTQLALYLIKNGVPLNKIYKKYHSNSNNSTSTLLMLAVIRSNMEILKVLLQKSNSTINYQNEFNKETALHIALDLHNIEAARLLLIHGASLDIKSEKGTPLQNVLNNMENADFLVPFLKWLVSSDLTIWKTSFKNNILSLFSKDCTLCNVLGKGERLFLYLLEQGANPNATNSNGFFILQEAIFIRAIPYVKLLLEFGADKDAVNKHGISVEQTLLQIVETIDDKLTKLLKETFIHTEHTHFPLKRNKPTSSKFDNRFSNIIFEFD